MATTTATRCPPSRTDAPCNRGKAAAPRGRLRKRVVIAAVAALLVATMVYGETWLLEAPATACVECAVESGVARVLDGSATAMLPPGD